MERFTICPSCLRRSFHPKDIEESYCGRCHQFHARMYQVMTPEHLNHWLEHARTVEMMVNEELRARRQRDDVPPLPPMPEWEW